MTWENLKTLMNSIKDIKKQTESKHPELSGFKL